MNLKKNHYSRRALALLLTLVMCVGMIPTAFAAQQNSYHDPAEHWMQASGRTNELDANSVVTRETFKCGECGKATSFEVFRVPEYTRNGQPALSRNVKYSDGTMVDGVGKGDTMDGIPGKDATYTGYHYTKAVCETCGGINTNMSKSEYGYLKNVYWLYDCAAAFTQELDETVSYEYTDDTYHTVTTKGGTYCAFCYGTNHTVSRKLERHSMVTEVLPQPANGRFATVEKCSLCDYARYDYTAAKAVIADYYGVVDGKPHTITVSDLSEAGVRTSIRYEDNRGMFEMADGHALLRYLEAAYFGVVTWEIVPGTSYERAILGEVDKTTPEYRTFYQKICAGAAAHIKKRIGKERQNVKGPITEINKESFWDLIHEAKNACGQDMDAMLAYLKDRLVSMGPTQAQNFHDIIHVYEDLADKFGLWDAAGIMKEYGCSDDGFIDFRAWLIAQGREVYFAALADPDSLADVVPYGDCRFEQLSYVGDYAYEQLTGKSAYDQTDWSAYEALLMKLEQDIVYKDGIEFPREGADLKKYLPRLCAKHPEWDGQTRWNLQLKEIRDLIHAGKDYDRRQTSNKKKRSRGGEAR